MRRFAHDIAPVPRHAGNDHGAGTDAGRFAERRKHFTWVASVGAFPTWPSLFIGQGVEAAHPPCNPPASTHDVRRSSVRSHLPSACRAVASGQAAGCGTTTIKPLDILLIRACSGSSHHGAAHRRTSTNMHEQRNRNATGMNGTSLRFVSLVCRSIASLSGQSSRSANLCCRVMKSMDQGVGRYAAGARLFLQRCRQRSRARRQGPSNRCRSGLPPRPFDLPYDSATRVERCQQKTHAKAGAATLQTARCHPADRQHDRVVRHDLSGNLVLPPKRDVPG